MTDPTPAKLRELLLNEFSEDELKALCASIDIDYDRLAGTGTFGKTRALIDTVKSQDRLRNLQAKVRELRPAAYESAGFNQPSDPESPAPVTASSTTSTPAQTRRENSSSTSLWPWIALAAIILLCMIVGVSLLLPRLQGAGQPQAPTIAAVITPTGDAISALPATETPPAIVDGTEALDKGASELTTTLPVADQTDGVTVTPDAPTATPAEAAAASGGIVITVTATSTPVSATSTITPTTVPTDAHPSTLVIGNLNEQLPKFYRGEVDLPTIQQYWTGEALRSVAGFGTLRLPRAMRIQPSQRNTLESTYTYRNGPTLVRETTDGAVVTSRENWRYATSANPTVICETRDYVYNLVRVDGKYKVSEFSSRLVDSGC